MTDPSEPSPSGAEPPVQHGALEIRARAEVAGGLRAVASAFADMRDAGYSVIEGGRLLLRLNQKDGFDCPGCAWPDPDGERSRVAEYCENGAKAVAWEADKGRLTATFFRTHSVEQLRHQTDLWLGQQGRLTEPLVLRPGSRHYEPLGWDEAFALLADTLRGLSSPDEAVFYTSGRTSNEAAFLYQLFVRAYGTNNLPDCSNMCHESSGVGLGETLGIGKGSVTLEDFDHADTIVVMGQNPGTNHPRMLTALQNAKRRGAKIIAVNPLPETGLMRFSHPQHPTQALTGGTPLADLFLQVQINGDVALLKALMALMVAEEDARPGSVLDHAFLAAHTEGVEPLLAHLRAQDVDALSAQCGVPRARLEEAVRLLLRGPNMIVCWAMGLTQHKNGVANIREIVNLLLLRGSIGKQGAGTCPVRGHSNVQGDRTMGIHERPAAALLDRIAEVFGFEPPRAHGLNTVEAIAAMDEGRAQVFFGLGGNFLSASPDTGRTARALTRCALTAHVSTKLNRGHLIHGETALILPCLGRTERDVQASGEQFATVENSMGVVHSSRGTRPPASELLLSEPALVARLAAATLGPRTPVDWAWLVEDYDRVRDRIAETIPGFERFNERVRRPGGFLLTNSARERRWNTASGKAQLTVNPAPDLSRPPGTFRMMTIRSHDQYNTTIYGLDDRYRGLRGDRHVVMMHEADIARAGLEAGQPADLHSDYGGTRRTARSFIVVPYDVPEGCVATYFPEANVLVPLERVAERSHTPASKDVLVRIEPSA